MRVPDDGQLAEPEVVDESEISGTLGCDNLEAPIDSIGQQVGYSRDQITRREPSEQIEDSQLAMSPSLWGILAVFGLLLLAGWVGSFIASVIGRV